MDQDLLVFNAAQDAAIRVILAALCATHPHKEELRLAIQGYAKRELSVLSASKNRAAATAVSEAFFAALRGIAEAA